MERELNTRDIRTVGIILLLGMIMVVGILLWASRTIAQDKKTVLKGDGKAPKFIIPTGITLRGCKKITVYLSTNKEHILSAIWSDKGAAIPAANPVLCDASGKVKIYLLPSQDYEIQQEAK